MNITIYMTNCNISIVIQPEMNNNTTMLNESEKTTEAVRR